jgi:predicted DNA-binding transcriptional regulator AlpA
MTEQLYLSVADLATRYSVSTRTIWRWVAEGHLPQPEQLPGNVRRWLTCGR